MPTATSFGPSPQPPLNGAAGKDGVAKPVIANGSPVATNIIAALAAAAPRSAQSNAQGKAAGLNAADAAGASAPASASPGGAATPLDPAASANGKSDPSIIADAATVGGVGVLPIVVTADGAIGKPAAGRQNGGAQSHDTTTDASATTDPASASPGTMQPVAVAIVPTVAGLDTSAATAASPSPVGVIDQATRPRSKTVLPPGAGQNPLAPDAALATARASTDQAGGADAAVATAGTSPPLGGGASAAQSSQAQAQPGTQTPLPDQASNQAQDQGQTQPQSQPPTQVNGAGTLVALTQVGGGIGVHATSRGEGAGASAGTAATASSTAAGAAARSGVLPNFGFVAASPTTAVSPGPTTAPSGLVPIDGLAVAIVTRAQAGSNQFAIRLDPPELGRIEVRLDVDSSGQVTSHVTVDRPDTLQLLQTHQPQLERALEQAGLKTTDNGLQFTLRDQSFAGQNGNGAGRQNTANLVIPDTDSASIDATQIYSRLRLGNGLDIRV